MPLQWPLLYLATATVFISLIRFPESRGFRDSWYCNRSFTCGGLSNLHFPFWLDSPTNSPDNPCKVKGFGLMRCNDSGSNPLINFPSKRFRVLQVNQSGSGGSVTVAHEELWESPCPWNFWDGMNLGDPNLVRYSETNQNLSLFYRCDNCSIDNCRQGKRFSCGALKALWVNNWGSEQSHGCEWGIKAQVNGKAYDALQNGSMDLLNALRRGFDVNFNSDDMFCSICESASGKCERASDSFEPHKCKPIVYVS